MGYLLKVTPVPCSRRSNVGLKINIHKAKIMASGPITSWQIDEEKVETVADFIFLGSKITVDSNCSQEIKRHLLLGRKTLAHLHSILTSRGITLLTKVVMYRCELWIIKKAECQRIVAFELWCWRRILDCKKVKSVNPKGNQS